MRDPKRSYALLAKVQELWNMFPDLRFWQVISLITKDEIFKNMKDPFFVEDDKWIEAVDNIIKKYKR